MNPAYQYRVVYQREGLPRKAKVFARRTTAERMIMLMGPTPWLAFGRGPSDDGCIGHASFRSVDGSCCPNWGLSMRQVSDRDRCDMPKLLFAYIERRAIGEWVAI